MTAAHRRGHCTARGPAHASVLGELVDDEFALEVASTWLVTLARRRRLSPPAEDAALGLLGAIKAVRRLRRAVEAEIEGRP